MFGHVCYVYVCFVYIFVYRLIFVDLTWERVYTEIAQEKIFELCISLWQNLIILKWLCGWQYVNIQLQLISIPCNFQKCDRPCCANARDGEAGLNNLPPTEGESWPAHEDASTTPAGSEPVPMDEAGVHLMNGLHSSGAVWESRWPSWAVRPNKPSGFRGRKELLNRASALVTTCP